MRFSMGLDMMDCRSQHGSRSDEKRAGLCRLRRQKIGVARMGTHAPRYSWAGSREIFLTPAACRLLHSCLPCPASEHLSKRHCQPSVTGLMSASDSHLPEALPLPEFVRPVTAPHAE